MSNYLLVRAKDFDYVMWVDADLIFLDMGLRLEAVAAEYLHSHIMISAGDCYVVYFVLF